MNPRAEVPIEEPVGEICLSGSNKMLVTGTSASGRPGLIKVYSISGNLTPTSLDFQCHSGPVTCMRMSYDNGHLFTGSEDGSICIFAVNDPEYKGVARARDRESAADFAEEVRASEASTKTDGTG
jgi:WD40 repeat protein